MEIVKVESAAEMNRWNVYYELDGKFYARCAKCGKPVEIECHRTAHDLKNDTFIQEFCDESCEKDWFIANYPTRTLAEFAGEDERSAKFYGEFEVLGDVEYADREFDVTFASITRYYDDDGFESREDVIISTAHSLEELLGEAESTAHECTRLDEFFSDLKRTGNDSVQVNDEGSIWVSIEYSTGDWSTDVEVCYDVEFK